jgi:hypothetical protein
MTTLLIFLFFAICFIFGALAIGRSISLDEKNYKPLNKNRKYKSAFRSNIVGRKASDGYEIDSPEYY